MISLYSVIVVSAHLKSTYSVRNCIYSLQRNLMTNLSGSWLAQHIMPLSHIRDRAHNPPHDPKKYTPQNICTINFGDRAADRADRAVYRQDRVWFLVDRTVRMHLKSIVEDRKNFLTCQKLFSTLYDRFTVENDRDDRKLFGNGSQMGSGYSGIDLVGSAKHPRSIHR